MNLIDSLQEYLRFLQHEQGAAKTTLKSYGAYLRYFHRWLTENGYAAPAVSDFNPATIKRYFYAVSGKGLRPRSVYNFMVCLRSYGAWLITQGVLSENPALSVKLPKKDAAIRQEATEQEVAALLQAVGRQRNQTKATFQRAVIATLTFTGLRRAEVCDLKLTDADLLNGWLLVRSGKGSKSRKVPLCDEVKDALAAWLAVRPSDTVHDYLFSVDRKRRLYFAGLRSVVEDVKAMAGLSDRTHLTPHSLRHACASRLMHNGASLHDVMTWLGHSQLSTTQRYLHCNEARLQSVANLAALPAPKPQAQDGKILRLQQARQEPSRERVRHRLAR